MALSVNVTVSMPMEMVQNIDEEADAHGMSRAQYIREAIQLANGTPFTADRTTLSRDDEEQRAKA
ncbi:ribbon-helix-helix protein, CopG family [Haloferax namakaokahaiae]|uniref:Ribbon-helix-helix protein, CopG family n=1 Tax=Haloferax namakaokahaiae TaxID=1748331 RepID=A0ABD5ZHW0_9EURY